MSALHILKGTQIFYLAPSFVKLSFWCQATWSFSEQPSYSSHLTLCPALLSAFPWELSPPQAGASGPIAKGPIHQRLCPRHAQHLHQRIVFLTKKDQMAIKRLEPSLDPQYTAQQMLPSGGHGPDGRCRWPLWVFGPMQQLSILAPHIRESPGEALKRTHIQALFRRHWVGISGIGA